MLAPKFRAAGGSGAESLTGTAADDLFSGGGGNDTINGAGGYDTAYYAGNFAEYQILPLTDGNWQIKDLRTNYETSATQKVLDGDLDPFIEASLKQGV